MIFFKKKIILYIIKFSLISKQKFSDKISGEISSYLNNEK